MVLVSAIEVSCLGGYSEELNSVKFREDADFIYISTGNKQCSHTYQILMAEDSLHRKLDVRPGSS